MAHDKENIAQPTTHGAKTTKRKKPLSRRRPMAPRPQRERKHCPTGDPWHQDHNEKENPARPTTHGSKTTKRKKIRTYCPTDYVPMAPRLQSVYTLRAQLRTRLPRLPHDCVQLCTIVGTTVRTCASSPHACTQMYTFVCTAVRNIAPPAPCLCSSAHNCMRNCAQEWPACPMGVYNCAQL